MSFQKYLIRASRLNDNKMISLPAKGIKGALKFSDNLLGMSARKMRIKLDATKGIARGFDSKGLRVPAHVDDILHNYTRNQEALTRRSNSTRIKTGLGLGAAALVHRSLKNKADETQAYQNQYYSY